MELRLRDAQEAQRTRFRNAWGLRELDRLTHRNNLAGTVM